MASLLGTTRSHGTRTKKFVITDLNFGGIVIKTFPYAVNEITNGPWVRSPMF